jgi:2-phosphosulfolactate phosphatase
MIKTVIIDYLPERAARYLNEYTIIAVDVVRATTTAISAVAAGRRCFPVPTLEAALELADRLGNVLLVGEQKGIKPPGFDLNNSPVQLLARTDIERPVVLLSSSGTRLCHKAAKGYATFLACLRNYASVASYIAVNCNFPKVAVIGAGNRGEFREEDQMCCAWIAERLLGAGYLPEDGETADIVKRWSKAPVNAWTFGKSAAYLRESGQTEDLDFILRKIADLNAPFMLRNGEVVTCDPVSNTHELVMDAQRSYQ